MRPFGSLRLLSVWFGFFDIWALRLTVFFNTKKSLDPKLYKAAMEGNMEPLTTIVAANPALKLNLCLTPQKNTVLHIAVEFGHQNIVEKVIQLCPSLIYQQNSKGDTPLHRAARAGRLDLTKVLTPTLNLNSMEGILDFERGSPVRLAGGMALRIRNLEGSNAIHEAIKKSHKEVALYLLAFEEGHQKLARDDNKAGESLLYLAAEAGLGEVVQEIIDSGGYSTRGPYGQNPLHIAVIKGQLGVVKILLDKASYLIPQADAFGNTVLHYASAENYRKVLADDEGADCCQRHITEKQNQRQILKLLLEAYPSLAHVPNRNGDYPLFFAIIKASVWAVSTILDYCPDTAELVNQKGQNGLHLAVLGNCAVMGNCDIICNLIDRLECKMLINEFDNDGNTPMHLAARKGLYEVVELLIVRGSPDLTISNKKGFTALDICGYQVDTHRVGNRCRESGAIAGRSRWQERYQLLPPYKAVSPELKKAIKTLPVVTVLVATVTFAAAFTVPGGYKNDGPSEGLPVFMGNTALRAFVLSDTLAFCSSMAATVLLVYANAHSEDAFKIYWALQTCYYISGAAILATITAFVAALYVLTSEESLWLAVTSLVLGFGVPLFLACYRWGLEKLERYLFRKDGTRYTF